MSVIEGVGDEVIIVAILVTILFLITAILLVNFSSSFNISSLFGLHLPQPQQATVVEPQVEAASNDSTSDINVNNASVKSSASSETPKPDQSIPNSEQQNDIQTDLNSGQTDLHVEGEPTIDNLKDSPQDVERVSNHEEEHTSQTDDPLPVNMFRVRLKYLNDTERNVTAEPTMQIKEFKSIHFVDDISNNKTVRLIFNGQLLRDTATVMECGIADGTVVHVHISNMPSPPQTVTEANAYLDLSNFFWPLLAIIFGICWISYIQYPQFFNVPSIVLLVVLSITVSVLIACMHSSVGAS